MRLRGVSIARDMEKKNEYDVRLRRDFKRIIERDRLSHAYLFFGGDAGVRDEKRAWARSLAHFLERGAFEVSPQPLRECIEIEEDEAGRIGIDAARTLKEFLFGKPVFSKWRVALLCGADALTPEAANALLKIVEEPPRAACIMAIADSEENVPDALRSRFQRIYFPARASRGTGHAVREARDAALRLLDADVDRVRALRIAADLIDALRYDPIRNVQALKAVLRHLVAIKRVTVNVRLQMRALRNALGE